MRMMQNIASGFSKKNQYPFCEIQNIESLLIRNICLLFEIKQMLHITLILMLNKTDIYCVYTI